MSHLSFSLRGKIAWLILAAWVGATGDTARAADRALIIVGLPGDSSHEVLFARAAKVWRDWLVGPLGFAATQVRILSGAAGSKGLGDAPATRESIGQVVSEMREQTPAIGRLWVFVIGHANLDDGHAFLHLPGPDVRDDEFAALFRGLVANEQVFWLTTPAAGAFLRPLSTPGRIVIAATEPSGEVNETEFPQALADVIAGPTARLDLDRNGKITIREIYLATVQAVEARFQKDQRAPTEHAQLDDNGDGIGTELQADPKTPIVDGDLASKVFLPSPTLRSQHGQDRTVPTPR